MRRFAACSFYRQVMSVAFLGLLLLACKQDRGEPDLGVRKPMPPPPGLRTSAPTIALTPVTTSTAAAAEAKATTQPAAIPPEVASVFDEMDRAFASSKSRKVGIRSRIEMISSARGYRAQSAIEMSLQFPNLLNLRVAEVGESCDRETTTVWSKFESPRSGILSDGKTMLLKKGFVLTQKAPASLDEVIDEQIEIGAWGDNPLATCFLRTRPSDAFKKTLQRARLLQYTADQIDLELVTAAPLPVRQRNEIAESFGIVQHLTVDTRTMTPKRCVVDLTELSREIYRRGSRKQDVAVERAFLELVVLEANLKADFTGQDVFVIPKEALPGQGSGGGSPPGFTTTQIGGTTEPAK